MNIFKTLKTNTNNKDIVQNVINKFKDLVKEMEGTFSKKFMEKSENRKLYVSNGYKTRYIWTPLGWCEITRHEYKNIATGKTIRPFDEELGLAKGLKVPSFYYSWIVNKTKKHHSYKEAGESFLAPLSSATICQILKKTSK